MAQNLHVQMIENVAIDTTPNITIGGMSNDDLMALLDAEENQADHDEVVEPSIGVIEANVDTDIKDLLGDLDLDLTAGVVAAEPAVTPAVIEDAELLADVVAAAESTEIAAAAATVDVIEPGAAPTTALDGSDAMVMGASADDLLAELETVVHAEPVAAEAKPEKKARTPKAEGAAAAAPRKHYTDKVERLVDRVGEDLSGVSMLTPADAALDPKEALDRTLHIIKGMNKKEQNRASNLVEFVTGKRSALNPVLDRVIRLAHKDGFVTTGENGTVMADLKGKYSPASARAMGANTVAVFADLMLLKADGKGRYVANPESVLLQIVKQMMGLV